MLHSIGVGRGASTKQLIAYLKAQMKKAEPYTRMKLMAVGLQVKTCFTCRVDAPVIRFLNF